jgi:FkbM family methyltransferase
VKDGTVTDLVPDMGPLLTDEGLHPTCRSALGQRGRYVTPRGSRTVLSHHYARPVWFLVNNSDDRIHAEQMTGRFYEERQLATMAEVMPTGGTFLDIGANIGNHSLYMLCLGGAERVVPVEPNPKAVQLLVGAMMLNRMLGRVDLSGLGYGAGAERSDGMAVHDPKGNLGWAKLKHARDGEDTVPVRAVDDIVADAPVHFVKIDVEGMEIEALKGLRRTIERDRPPIFIEVDRHNREAFFTWMEEHDYEVAEAFGERKINQNFMLMPKGGMVT